MWKCKWCENEFNELTASQKANHTRWCEKNPKRSEYKNNMQVARAAIKKHRNQFTKARDLGLKKPKSVLEGLTGDKSYFFGKHHTKETKDRISKSRSKFLRENPEEHPWKKSDKFRSEPCETLKKKLREHNIVFSEEYTPLSDRLFSIDIAIPKKRIGIEVNGNQHYNKNGELKKYYKDRHELIESRGWKLIELHYSEVYKDLIVEQLKNVLG